MGRLRKELRKMQIADNTFLVWTTDSNVHHGKAGRESETKFPFTGTEHWLYEGGLRVPTLVEWPSRICNAFETKAIGSHYDWYPTFLEAAGVKLENWTVTRDGISLLPVLTGKSKSRGVELLHSHSNGAESWTKPQWVNGIVCYDKDGKHKYMRNFKGDSQLFNVEEDIAEKKDLKSQKPELAKKLNQLCNTYWKSVLDSKKGLDYPKQDPIISLGTPYPKASKCTTGLFKRRLGLGSAKGSALTERPKGSFQVNGKINLQR